MSVRSSILAILSLGSAYGFQIHGEIETRTLRVGEINVGQIYSTLDRLVSHGLVTSSEKTQDGLPLYALTSSGRLEAESWLSSSEKTDGASWQLMINHLLLAGSLPGRDVTPLIEKYRENWVIKQNLSDATEAPLSVRSELRLAQAALAWLTDVELYLKTNPPITRPLGAIRPRRGRRPHTSQ